MRHLQTRPLMIAARSNLTCRLCARPWQHDGITVEAGGYPQTQSWLADGCVCGGRLEEDCTRGTSVFKCDGCGQNNAEYNFTTKRFGCPCGHHSEPQQGQETRCFSCYKAYTRYQWFDPSGCPHCFRSFVD